MTSLLGILAIILSFNLSSRAQEVSNSGQRWFKQLGPSEAYPQDNTFKRCHNEFGFPIIQNHREEILTDCFPEAVYSWGTADKAKEIFKKLKNKNNWDLPVSESNIGKSTLSAALTPVSTIFYGPTQLRMKIKPGVRYEYREGLAAWTNCDTLDPKSEQNSVFILEKPIPDVGFTYEVVICNFKVLESISANTETAYQETLRDLYLAVHKPELTYSYIQYSDKKFKGKIFRMIDINFLNKAFFKKQELVRKKVVGIMDHPSPILDSREVAQKTLETHLESFQKSVEVKNFQFLTNPDSHATLEQHFQVREPLPFQKK